MRFTNSSTDGPSRTSTLGLWKEYRETGDARLRDRLTLTFAPLVKSIAYRKLRGLPAHVPVEELISSGLEALITALDRYDPAKGATLEQFLWTRISGGIIDELRRNDWAPRSLRTTQRELRGARRDFRAIHHRAPSDEELSDAAGITVKKLHAHQQDELAMDSVSSLNVMVSDRELGSTERGELLVAPDGDPEAAAFGRVDSDALAAALDTLTVRERTVIGLLYSAEMTLGEVGQIIGVSESRVCQINRKAKIRLREQLELAGGALALVS
jgi:RNA polymerase sigma factor for flagellar operon FliA